MFEGLNLISFSFSRLGLFFTILFGLIGLLSILYSLSDKRVNKIWGGIILLTLSGIGIALANNLLLVFVLWEISTIAVWQLVAYYRDPASLRASALTFLFNLGSATFMLVGIGLIFLETKTLDLSLLSERSFSLLAGILVLISILTKSAILPFYIWLVPAYKNAPIPAIASLSGIAENIGLILFLKLFVLTATRPMEFYSLGSGLAIVSSILAGGIALLAPDLRKVLTYSTISQLGLILFGLSVMKFSGVMGGILHILTHSLAKPGLFFAMGILETRRGGNEKIAISWRRLSLPFALLSLSLIGLPPFLGFFSKLGIVIGAIESSYLFGIGAIVSSLFTLLYLVRIYRGLFLSNASSLLNDKSNQGNAGIGIGIIYILAFLSLLLGIFFFLLIKYLEPELRLWMK